MPDDEGPCDIRTILERLPHRLPMLLVDRVVELKQGSRLVAIKNVTINEDYFRGHFPGNPILPGVLILESLSQAAGLLIASCLESTPPVAPYLVGVEGAKFRRPVIPGDQLLLEVEVLRRRRRYWRFRATARVGMERAAEAEILLAVLGDERQGTESAR